MAKGSKSVKNEKSPASIKAAAQTAQTGKARSNSAVWDNYYLFHMNEAQILGESTHWFQMLPAVFFTTVIIMIVKLASYTRDMTQFYFYSPNASNNLSDFFSYDKMVAIVICAALALTLLLYKAFSQSLYIKASYAYIPMAVYSLFVVISYVFSDYKEFALWGWNDRFEGTVTLLAYMMMLFYIINIINSEQNVRWIINMLGVVSTFLGVLGITQAMNHDFFRTTFGKKLITPMSFWNNIDSLNFTFTTQIYQTVYNINYVSFYLTLLIPIFGILFIRSFMLGKDEPLYKKIIWGALFTLVVFNLIGSASSGGLMGMAFVVLVALIVLNKKILNWWKPVIILLILSLLVAGISFDRWTPELQAAFSSASGQEAKEAAASSDIHKLDYLVTSGNAVSLGYEGEEINFTTYPEDPSSLTVTNSKGENLPVHQIAGDAPQFAFDDEAYDWITFKPAMDSDNNHYLVILTDKAEWPFMIANDGVKYFSGIGRLMNLVKVPAVGWENNQQFGSGRGYIWSRTIPMVSSTLLIGHGADTFCIYFPHYDYVGKYNSGTFTGNINIIVDKPHNMYFDSIIGTGGISMLALLLLWGIYLIKSFLLYRKQKFDSYLSFVGAGIFFGICGFLVSGLVNDSNVSVMPMFYGLFGMGIAINTLLEKQSAE